MAIALKIGIGDLTAEFLAHTFVFLRLSQAAGAVAVLGLEPLLDVLYDLFIFIIADLHRISPFPFDAIVAHSEENRKGFLLFFGKSAILTEEQKEGGPP